MIKINLASKKQPGLSAAGGGNPLAGGKFDLEAIKAKFRNFSPEMLKELPLQKVGIPVVIAVAAWFTFENYKSSEIEKFQTQITIEQAKIAPLQKEAEKIKTYEDLKKEIDRDEITIRTKIETIQKLIAGRSEPSKLLVVLSKSIPEEVWLTNFTLGPQDISIVGMSDGFGPITDMMKNLGETSFFNDLELKNSSKSGGFPSQEVTSFDMVAKRK